MKCPYCADEKLSARSLSAHKRLCKLNPDRAKSPFEVKGREPWNKGKTKDDDTRLAEASVRCSETHKQRIADGHVPGYVVWVKRPEVRLAKSEWRKRLHEAQPETHPNRRLANNRSKCSYPEQLAFDWLVANGIQFEHQKKISRYYVDFCIDKLIIEIDGAYWHDADRDAKREAEICSFGYKIVRIKASDHIHNALKEIFGV